MYNDLDHLYAKGFKNAFVYLDVKICKNKFLPAHGNVRCKGDKAKKCKRNICTSKQEIIFHNFRQLDQICMKIEMFVWHYKAKWLKQ